MPDLPPLSQCSNCNYIGKSLFLSEPCRNCERCSDPQLVRHDKFTQPLNEACNFQFNKQYDLAFDKAFELTQLIEQAIQYQYQNTVIFPTKWEDIQNIAQKKSQGYLVQEKDSEEAIKLVSSLIASVTV
ncbi:MAG: hypothetical protein RLZZ04_663 [Cyanobacteriota bacterium]|jgi:hypothetical protein